MTAIHSHLKQLRQDRGMTQETVAQRMGLTRQAVSSHESGRTRPDLDTLMRYAEVYDVDLHDILYGGGRPQSRRVRLLAWAVWLDLTLCSLAQSVLLWVSNSFFPVPEGVLSGEMQERLITRMALGDLHRAVEEVSLLSFGLLSLGLMAAALRMERPVGVRRRWKYCGLLTAGAAAAVLPWAVADPIFGIANYTVTPSAQLAWAAVLLLVSLAADAVRLRRQK